MRNTIKYCQRPNKQRLQSHTGRKMISDLGEEKHFISQVHIIVQSKWVMVPLKFPIKKGDLLAEDALS